MLRLAIFFLILPVLGSYPVTGQSIYGTNTGSLNFHSDAPLELISAASKELRGKLETAKKNFAFVIKINSFTGFNNPLQREHFNENYLESDKYPNATFTGRIIEDIDFSVEGNYSVRAKGNLTVHGISQERIIKCELVVKKSMIGVRSNFTVLLADHNISIPKIVHEKLASEIKVEVKADLVPQ